MQGTPQVLPLSHNVKTQIAKFMGPTWGPRGSCRPQMGPMLVPWTLLSGDIPLGIKCNLNLRYPESYKLHADDTVGILQQGPAKN